MIIFRDSFCICIRNRKEDKQRQGIPWEREDCLWASSWVWSGNKTINICLIVYILWGRHVPLRRDTTSTDYFVRPSSFAREGKTHTTGLLLLALRQTEIFGFDHRATTILEAAQAAVSSTRLPAKWSQLGTRKRWSVPISKDFYFDLTATYPTEMTSALLIRYF